MKSREDKVIWLIFAVLFVAFAVGGYILGMR